MFLAVFKSESAGKKNKKTFLFFDITGEDFTERLTYRSVYIKHRIFLNFFLKRIKRK